MHARPRSSASFRPVSGAVLLLLAAFPATAQVALGPERRMGTTYATPGGLFARSVPKSVAMAPDGRFVVAWTRDAPSDQYDIFARTFSAGGRARDPGFLVNTYTTGPQLSHALAIDAAGNFVVVWAGGGDVFGRRFTASGAPLGGDFQVNEPTIFSQQQPSIAMEPDGDFVVVWSGGGILGRRFEATGVPVGGEFRVDTSAPPLGVDPSFPSVASDPAGGFVVVWQGDYWPSAIPIRARVFTAAGPQGPEFDVSTASGAVYPRVARRPDGAFVVAWSLNSSSSDARVRRFDASGVPIGAEFAANQTSPAVHPDVAVDPSGGFVVAWRGVGGVIARRFDAAGQGGSELTVAGPSGYPTQVSVASDTAGNFNVVWLGHSLFGRRYASGLMGTELVVDPSAAPTSDGNGVLEPEEAVTVAPRWLNAGDGAATFTGTASGFTGPGTGSGTMYALLDGAARYGTVPGGVTGTCSTTGDCFVLGVASPGGRPGRHWDAQFKEDIAPAALGALRNWPLHVGDSFADVPRSGVFYRFVEALLHHGVTAGCSADAYCPGLPTTREQMAVFVLAADQGVYQPPSCLVPTFLDVPPASPFCPWIEELARRGVVGGCGNGLYCPLLPVSREQMAVFVLRTLEPALAPPPCMSPAMFADVPASSPFCRWVEEVARRGVVAGCGGGNYCPTAPVTREQMAVFLSVTFGLPLYGP